MIKATIRVENLAKTYQRRAIIHSVSLQVEQGSIVGLLGPNGAGKTTLFYMICGLVEPTRGKVYLADQDITHLPMHQRAKQGIGYLPQEPSIFTHLTVAQNIGCVAQLHNNNWQGIRDHLIKDFALETIRHSLGYQLSGGERRRVEIARALAANPKFILLDEPFAGVDPISISDTKAIVSSLAERHIGVIITDHNVSETLSICHQAYILAEGHLIAQGNPQQVVQNQQVLDTYLGANFQL